LHHSLQQPYVVARYILDTLKKAEDDAITIVLHGKRLKVQQLLKERYLMRKTGSSFESFELKVKAPLL